MGLWEKATLQTFMIDPSMAQGQGLAPGRLRTEELDFLGLRVHALSLSSHSLSLSHTFLIVSALPQWPLMHISSDGAAVFSPVDTAQGMACPGTLTCSHMSWCGLTSHGIKTRVQ